MSERKKYLNLIRELAMTGFKLKYSDSVLGYFWSLGRPLLLFLIYYVIFAYIFKIGRDIENYPLYLLTGIVLWQFFVETTTLCMGSIQSNGSLIRKVYFPRIALPLASSLTALLTLILNFLVIIAFLLYSQVWPDWSWFLVIPLFLEFYIFTLGVSLILATVFVKYRDIGVIWGVITQGLFYATPILYSIEMVPERFQKYVLFNPAAQVIMDTRTAVLGDRITSSSEVLGGFGWVPFIIVLGVVGFGYFVFKRRSAYFAEEV